jgi:hypothetical protein
MHGRCVVCSFAMTRACLSSFVNVAWYDDASRPVEYAKNDRKRNWKESYLKITGLRKVVFEKKPREKPPPKYVLPLPSVGLVELTALVFVATCVTECGITIYPLKRHHESIIRDSSTRNRGAKALSGTTKIFERRLCLTMISRHREFYHNLMYIFNKSEYLYFQTKRIIS